MANEYGIYYKICDIYIRTVRVLSVCILKLLPSHRFLNIRKLFLKFSGAVYSNLFYRKTPLENLSLCSWRSCEKAENSISGGEGGNSTAGTISNRNRIFGLLTKDHQLHRLVKPGLLQAFEEYGTTGFTRSCKVMEFENAFSRPGKVTDSRKNGRGHGKVMEFHFSVPRFRAV